MNLAAALLTKVTSLADRPLPKEDKKQRASDRARSTNALKRKEQIFDALDTPMTSTELSEKTGFSRDFCHSYLFTLHEEGRVKRSMKTPYTYWR
jgi:hypothetical protein